MIIEGTYGQITVINDKIIKKSNLLEGDIINHVNYNELLFLKSLINNYHIQFPNVIQCNIIDNKIIIEQKYHGETLHNKMTKFKYFDRLNKLSYYIFQIFIFLYKLKENNIVHMDIKPTNICVSDDDILTFIDFGFVVKPTKYTNEYCGTYSLCDPSYLDYSKKPNYCYDMFSSGLSLIAFLIKSYIHNEVMLNFKLIPETITNDNLIKESGLDLLRKDLDDIDPILYEILCRMIEVDENKRIKPDEILKYEYFKKYYTQIEINTNISFEKPMPICLNIIKKTNLMNFIIHENFNDLTILLLPSSLIFFNNYINENKISKEKLNLYFYSVLYIQCLMSSIINISNDICKKFTIKMSELNDIVVEITNNSKFMYYDLKMLKIVKNKDNNYYLKIINKFIEEEEFLNIIKLETLLIQ